MRLVQSTGGLNEGHGQGVILHPEIVVWMGYCRSLGYAPNKIDPQPFPAGLTFRGRPSAPRINLAVSFLSQLAIGKLAAPTARRGRRDDKV
jgi:hypothetical protein